MSEVRAGGQLVSCSELRALFCGDHVTRVKTRPLLNYPATVSPIRNVQRPVVHARTVVDDGYNRHFRLGRGCPTKARVKKVNINLPIVLDPTQPTYPIPIPKQEKDLVAVRHPIRAIALVLHTVLQWRRPRSRIGS